MRKRFIFSTILAVFCCGILMVSCGSKKSKAGKSNSTLDTGTDVS